MDSPDGEKSRTVARRGIGRLWFRAGVALVVLNWFCVGESQAETVDRIHDDLYAAHFSTADEGWVVGSNGGIYHTTDRGKIWQKQFSDTLEALYDVHFFPDGKTGWIAGKSGLLLRTVDGGKKWLPPSATPGATSLV